MKNCTCYYFDDKIKDRGIHSLDIILDKKSYERYKNISVYDIWYKTSTGSKPSGIKFVKIDGFIRVCDGKFKHLVLCDYGLFDKICDKIKEDSKTKD